MVCVVCVVVIGGIATSYAGPATSCTCSNIADLRNMLNEADAAIAANQYEIDGMLAAEKTSGKPVLYTVETYKGKLQVEVQKALDQISPTWDPSIHRTTAETSEFLCNTTIHSPTSCLAEVVDKHEAVHRAACNATTTWTKLADMRLVDKALEEIRAYTAARTYILSVLQIVPRVCQPKGWFGTVTYTITEHTDVTTNVEPRKGEFGDTVGGSNHAHEETTFAGAIYVDNDAPTAHGTVSYSLQGHDEVHGSTLCSPKQGKHASSSSVSRSASASGSSTGAPDFSVSIDRSKVGRGEISFRPLSHQLLVKGSITGSASGGCRPPPAAVPVIDALREFGMSDYAQVPGRLDADALLFTGESSTPIQAEQAVHSATGSVSSGIDLHARFALHRLR